MSTTVEMLAAPWSRPGTDQSSVLADLRAVAAGSGVLTMRQYARSRTPQMLSPAWIAQSFGSWSTVCAAAGLGTGPAAAHTSTPSWSVEQLHAAVDDFLLQAHQSGTSGSYREFVRWCAAEPYRPCATSVRVRLGRWNTVKTESLTRLEGVR